MCLPFKWKIGSLCLKYATESFLHSCWAVLGSLDLASVLPWLIKKVMMFFCTVKGVFDLVDKGKNVVPHFSNLEGPESSPSYLLNLSSALHMHLYCYFSTASTSVLDFNYLSCWTINFYFFSQPGEKIIYFSWHEIWIHESSPQGT